MSDYKMITLPSELEGKTVQVASGVGHGGDIMLVFTDGTMARFTVEQGYDPGDEEVELSEKQPDAGELLDLGLITVEERNARWKREQQAREEESRQVRRTQYEQLKREFEG